MPQRPHKHQAVHPDLRYLISCSWQEAPDGDGASRGGERGLHHAAHEGVHEGWGHLPPLLHLIQDLQGNTRGLGSLLLVTRGENLSEHSPGEGSSTDPQPSPTSLGTPVKFIPNV